ncbi:MAG TPA: lysozyme [Candidatus Elarobacter sp.]|nr:lysozyme [Candidatus Elarobacter sp.]
MAAASKTSKTKSSTAKKAPAKKAPAKKAPAKKAPAKKVPAKKAPASKAGAAKKPAAAAKGGLRQINQAGLDLIKSFEGYARQVAGSTDVKAYQDVVGIWTIGYGHTGRDVHEGLRITQAQAENLLRGDLATAERIVLNAVKVSLSDNEYAALVSFVFNTGSLPGTTLLRLLNAGDRAGAADQFLRWNKAGGSVVAGLTRRRKAERELFLKK